MQPRTFRKRPRPTGTVGDSTRAMLYCRRTALNLLAAGALLIPDLNAHPRPHLSTTAGDATAAAAAVVVPGHRYQAFSSVLAAAESVPGTADRSSLWPFVDDDGMFDPRQDYWNHSGGQSSQPATGSNLTYVEGELHQCIPSYVLTYF